MKFEVEPYAVEAYADVISVQADHQDKAISYLNEHVTIAYFAEASTYFYNDDYKPRMVECRPEGDVYEAGTYWGYCSELTMLSKQYHDLASDVSDFTGAMNDALNAVIDTLSWSLIAAAIGACTSWTGVGAVLGEGAAALLMGSVLSHISEYTSALSNIKTTVDAFTGMDSMAESPTTGFDSLKLLKPYETPPGM